MQAFWEVENIGNGHLLDPDDQLCEDYFNQTHFRDESGRFVVRLPFKPTFRSLICLGQSRNMAIYNWLSMERRLDKNHSMRNTYHHIMDGLIQMGYMQLIPPSQHQIEPQESCYLTHHMVSRGEKHRTVFNASKKTSIGFSLNDALLTGPSLQNNLFDIIVHVRQFRIAFSRR